MSDAPATPARWIAVVTTHPGAGFLVRWRSRARSIDAHPPALASVALGDATLATVDASELECLAFPQPFSGGVHEVIPNGLLRFAAVAGREPRGEALLVMRLAFVAADGTPAAEGEDYEVLRAPPLRAVLAPEVDEPEG